MCRLVLAEQSSNQWLFLTACNNVQAGAKSTAATSLKFQAEATAHLQNTGVGRTQDAPKYQDKDIEVITNSNKHKFAFQLMMS